MHYPNQNLEVYSANPLLVYPTHYVGDDGWYSDTGQSHTHDTHTHTHTHTKPHMKKHVYSLLAIKDKEEKEPRATTHKPSTQIQN